MLKKKYTSPKYLATILCAFFAFVVGTVFGIGILLEQDWIYLIFATLLVFIIGFIVFYYSLNTFIIQRIEPIYKTIDSIKIPYRELFENITNTDIINELELEVMDWARDRTREIKELKQNEKYRKEFIGNVAHELKTPIFNIQGYISTLIDGGLYDDEINLKYLRRTEKNINRLISTIEDVDTISQLEAGMMRLNFEYFDLKKLIEEIFEMQEIRSNKYHIKLICAINDKTHYYVRADKIRIFDVINNLIVNSIKYGKPGGTTVIKLKNRISKIEVEISDNGIGISPKHQARIFERFYRVDKSRSREQGGSGLGLSIVKHILEAHQQKIWLKSDKNIGTTVTFTLEKSNQVSV